MKADTFIKILRKVIREEVQAVVREELGLMLEAPEPKPVVVETKKTTVKNSMVESIKPAKPTQPINSPTYTNNSILNEMLQQTAQQGEWRSVAEMNSSDVMGGFGSEPIVVNSVNEMFANTRPAGDINAVRIDAVPDFTALMSKMKQEGQI